MKTKLSLFILLVTALFMSGCNGMLRGDGQIVTNDVQVTDFDELNIACPLGEIRYVQSEEAPALSISTDGNIYDMLEIKQEGKKIYIKLKEKYNKKLVMPTKFVVVANSNALREFDLAGKAAFHLDSPFKGEKLDINVAGAGTIYLNDSLNVEELTTSLAGSSTVNAKKLAVARLKASIAGSGTYNLEGSARKVSFDIAGKGKVRALDLEAEEVSCNVAGYASLFIFATEKINAQIAGYSRIKYKGNPQIIQEGFASVSKDK